MTARVGNRRPWRVREQDYPEQGDMEARLRFLLRYAVLAPSSHNSQPWRFLVACDTVSVYADTDRWLRVADADRRELHIAIGCALENLLIAAEHFGYGHQLTRFPCGEQTELIATARFVAGCPPSAVRDSALFDVIATRRTNRACYDGKDIPSADLHWLAEFCAEEEVSVDMVTSEERKGRICELSRHATAIQFADPAYRRELGYWLGRGALGHRWPAAIVARVLVSRFNLGARLAARESAALESSPAVAVLSSQIPGPESELKIGQASQRLWLAATLLGIQAQPMSQILQIVELRRALTEILSARALCPQHLFRLGYGEAVSRPTPRRAVGEVLQ